MMTLLSRKCVVNPRVVYQVSPLFIHRTIQDIIHKYQHSITLNSQSHFVWEWNFNLGENGNCLVVMEIDPEYFRLQIQYGWC